MLGAREWGCLGRSSGGPVSGSLFIEGDKERQEWAAGQGICSRKSVYRRQRKAGMCGYLHVGPLIMALDPFYGLTSNFSCPYNLI
jgi:hypothetical protein